MRTNSRNTKQNNRNHTHTKTQTKNIQKNTWNPHVQTLHRTIRTNIQNIHDNSKQTGEHRMKTNKQDLYTMTHDEFCELVQYYHNNQTYWTPVNQFSSHLHPDQEMTPSRSIMQKNK